MVNAVIGVAGGRSDGPIRNSCRVSIASVVVRAIRLCGQFEGKVRHRDGAGAHRKNWRHQKQDMEETSDISLESHRSRPILAGTGLICKLVKRLQPVQDAALPAWQDRQSPFDHKPLTIFSSRQRPDRIKNRESELIV